MQQNCQQQQKQQQLYNKCNFNDATVKSMKYSKAQRQKKLLHDGQLPWLLNLLAFSLITI